MKAPLACLLFTLGILVPLPLYAQCVTVAPDICVSRKSYNAPVNEQPFFGFAEKTPTMIESDKKFVQEVVTKIGREKGVLASLVRASEAMTSGDFASAARRLNQAFLLQSNHSQVVHGFALVAQHRFRDNDFAAELFAIALKLPDRAPSLRGDYGRLLMIAKRPAEARPLLEQAVKDTPNSATVWNDLAFARLLSGEEKEACDAFQEALRRSPPQTLVDAINVVRSKAGCK